MAEADAGGDAIAAAEALADAEADAEALADADADADAEGLAMAAVANRETIRAAMILDMLVFLCGGGRFR